MKNTIILFIVALAAMLILANFPYNPPVKVVPFMTGNDVINSITSVDTIKWRPGYQGLNENADWNIITTYITATDKANEKTIFIPLSDESGWGWMDYVQFQISGNGQTLTSDKYFIGGRAGAFSLFVQPDTSGTNTTYKVRLGGQ